MMQIVLVGGLGPTLASTRTYVNVHQCGNDWCCNSGKHFSEEFGGCCSGEECDGVAGSDSIFFRLKSLINMHDCGSFMCCDDISASSP